MKGDSGGRKQHFFTKQSGRIYALIGSATTTLANVNLSVRNNVPYFIKPTFENFVTL